MRARRRLAITRRSSLSEATIPDNGATVAEQGAHVAPDKASSNKGATQKKGAPKSQRRRALNLRPRESETKRYS